MNIKKQVCTLEQSKELFRLLKTNRGHYFSWLFDILNERWVITGLNVESLGMLKKEGFPAFTVAELGMMLYRYADLPVYSYKQKKWKFFYKGELHQYKTEAEARAQLLIYCIKENHRAYKPAIVNNRLLKA